MGIIQKQSISGTIYSYVGVVLGFVTAGLLFPRIFSTEQVGLLRLLVSYAVLFSQFASLGINTATVKLFPYFRDKEKKHHGYLGIALLVILAGLVISIIIYLMLRPYFVAHGQEKSALFVTYFYYVVPLIIFTLLFNVFDTYYRVLYNAVKGIVYKEIVQRVLILVVIIGYALHMIDFRLTVILYVLAIISPAFFLFVSLIRSGQFFVKPDFSFVDEKLKKQFLDVSFFGMISTFSGVLVLNIDVIMVDGILGLSAAGIYTVTFFFGTLILVPLRTMGKIGSVVISDAWKANDTETIQNIYKKSSLSLSVIGFLLFIGIWGNIDNVFFIISNDYLSGKYVILFIGLAALLDIALGINPQIIINSKYYRYISYFLFIFAVLLIITNLLLIPVYGIVGAAIASLISKFIYNLIKFFFLYKKFGFQPFDYRYPLLILFSLIAYFASLLLSPFDNYILDIVVRSLFIFVMFSVPVYLFKISEDINEHVDKIIRALFNRTKSH
ncbi:MAG: polysaccharide biosynthesis protein [Bacteroidetes bacterium]|nr:MAG: polysaccharide biosynthesis protein [Bacteroidota bacterium]RLD88481.1 MAG: polysaccharide biosynthesis protein [Bacteroidota bacterium]